MSILFRHRPPSQPGSMVLLAGGFEPDCSAYRGLLLGQLLQQAGLPAAAPVLEREQGGRPFLRSGALICPVSVSHTKGLLLIALSTGPEIGLDAEHRERRVPERLQNRIRSLSRPAPEEHIPPLTLWTLKEAFLKMTGTGLRHPMNQVNARRTGSHHYICTTLSSTAEPVEAQLLSFVWRDYRIALSVRIPTSNSPPPPDSSRL
ncbi:MAG: 4'-phosphopantetheinyl transferase superfamily protein [Balneolales bacterium]|nr:4'-phosphopantetheinyl transferase superfamily protein [Balneolales bacterium]